jgi:hypothetical protein
MVSSNNSVKSKPPRQEPACGPNVSSTWAQDTPEGEMSVMLADFPSTLLMQVLMGIAGRFLAVFARESNFGRIT